MDNGARLKTLSGHDGKLFSFVKEWKSCECIIGKIRIWDMESGNCLKTFIHLYEEIYAYALAVHDKTKVYKT